MSKRPNYRRISKPAYKKLHKFCFFCGEDNYASLQCHRILPGEQGGTYADQNTLTVCASCHCKVHSGLIKIDRKYTQGASPFYCVHYWLNGEEFWRSEEHGTTTTGNYHSGLGKSRKISSAGADRSDDQIRTIGFSGKPMCNDSSREEIT